MKTIKIIDLINRIANGEEVPKKIKYDDEIKSDIPYFIYIKMGKCNNNTIINFLNDEVEILEEEKKLPEKCKHAVFAYSSLKDINYLEGYVNDLTDTVNELLDYLESKEKGE